MLFLKSGKLARLGLNFKYYFFINSFCFKQSPVLKIHRGMVFDSRNSRMTSKLPKNLLLLSYKKNLSKFTIQYISMKENEAVL